VEDISIVMTDSSSASPEGLPSPTVNPDLIRQLLLGLEDVGIRHRFVQTYGDQLEDFVGHMVNALVSQPSLGYLDRYARNTYSTTKAIRDVARHADALQLNRKALTTLQQHSKLYDLCSHPTQFASASLMTLVPANPQTVLGGHFDEGKIFAYEREISSRTSLASNFPNFIYAVGRNYLGLA